MNIKAGIIGLGVGEKHIAGFLKHPKCKVVGLCDFSEDKLFACQEKYQDVKVTKDADDILQDPQIDVVSIASYDNFHYEQIIKALRNGKHVFVEKPLCLHRKEAHDIRKLLRENTDLMLSSNLILRLSPRFKYLKSLISKGRLGKIYYLEGDYNYGRLHKITDGWRGRLEFYSVVYGGGVHMVDLLLWLLDGEDDVVKEVSSYGNHICSENSKFRYNDLVVSLLKFKSGRIAKIACNFGCVFPHFHSLQIYGTNATFINGVDNGKLYETRDSNKTPRIISDAYPGTHKGDLIYDFIKSIVEGCRPIVTEDDVFRTMSVCFAIEQSMNESKTVEVKFI